MPAQDEHETARVLAYFTALQRGNGYLPPYDPNLAASDFHDAAAYIESFEPDPDDTARKRPIPTVLTSHRDLDNHAVALDAFSEMKDELSDQDYWALLGHIWVSSLKQPNAFDKRYSDCYSDCLKVTRDHREYLMVPSERITLLHMPGEVTVYRGCQTGLNERGLSWTRDPAVAASFAQIYYPFGPRSLLQGKCNPRNAICYFNFDNEQELIIESKHVYDVEDTS